MDHADLVRNL
jgi:hypothetical protein